MAVNKESKTINSINKAAGAPRHAGFELLRIASIFFIICLHYLRQTGFLPETGTALTSMNVLAEALEILFIIFLNDFVLLSGYFMSRSFRLSRFLELLATVLFYSLGIPAVLALLGQPLRAGNLFEFWAYLMPVTMEHYWFVSSYMIVFLLAPFLAAGIEKLSEKELRTLILCLLFFTCFLPTVSPVKLTLDNAGYDTLWFLIMFLIGGYLRKYPLPKPLQKGSFAYFMGYLALSAVNLLFFLGVHTFHLKTEMFSYYPELSIHHNFIPVTLSSICVFLAFRELKIPEGGLAKLIRFVSPMTFGVYLLHEHLEIRDLWLPAIDHLLGPVPETFALVLHMLAAAAILFIACAAIDFLRAKLFKLLRISR